MRTDIASPRSTCSSTPVTPSSAAPQQEEDDLKAAKKGGQQSSVHARTVFFMSLWCADSHADAQREPARTTSS